MPDHRLHATDSHRRLLNQWIRAGSTPQRVATRARIVLMAADGKSARTIAAALKVNPRTVTLWRRRFAERGPDILWRDAPGRGRKRTIAPDAIARLRTLLASPPPGGGQWTVRRLADLSGLSRSTVHRLLSSANVRLISATQRKRAGAWLLGIRDTGVANFETPDNPPAWMGDAD